MGHSRACTCTRVCAVTVILRNGQVYLGAPNAKDYAPGAHAFIDALDFDSPESLAKFLVTVAGNDTLYNSYHKWRHAATLSEGFTCAVESDLTLMDKESALCRTCTLAAKLKSGNSEC